MSWEEALKLSRTIDPIYSTEEAQQYIIYKYASKLKKDNICLEIGTARGRTTAILCYIAKIRKFNYYGIDDFSLGGSKQEIKQTMKNLGLDEYFNLIVGKSADIQWNKEIDLLYIDGCHIPEIVKKDYEKYLPYLKIDGVVMIHDWEEPYNFQSAHWGIRYHGDEYTKNYKTLGLFGNLMVKRKI